VRLILLVRFSVVLSERDEDHPPEEEPRKNALAASLSRPTLERAVQEQITQLIGDFSGLEGISRFLQTVDIQSKEFMAVKEKLYFAQGAYVRGLKIGDKKNFEKMMKRELQNEVVKQLSEERSKSQMESIRSGWEKYFGIMKQYFAMGIFDPDPICILAWYQMNDKVREGFEAAYRGLQICMQEVCRSSGRKRFPISDEDYKEWLRAVHYEVIKGEQNTAVDEKVTTQLMVYAAYSNASLDEDLGSGVTLREIFRLSALVSCFDWLSEFYRPEFWNLWQKWHERFARAITIAREPLFRTFHRDIIATRSVAVVLSKIGEAYEYAFEIVDDSSSWLSGELKGRIELQPFDFKDRPDPEKAQATTILGPPGIGKTTILSALAGISVMKRKNVVCHFLADNTNWPTYAFLPLMPISRKLYNFSTQKIGTKPTGVPVLILNVVRDLSELRDETLTRYDRILKVKNYRSFHLEFPALIDELGRIAEEFGYSKSAGIITVRNLTRAGTAETTKRFSKEVQVATAMLDSFTSWRRNHAKSPFRLQFDELKETGMGRPGMQEHTQITGLIEGALVSARRQNFGMDFAGQLTQQASATVRELTLNTIFKSLPVEHSGVKSPQDILLDSLKAPDEEKDAIRLLEETPAFGKTRLLIWHDAHEKRFDLLHTIPPPFQPQIPGQDPKDVYDYFLAMNKQIDPEKFYRKDLKFDWVAGDAENPTAAADVEEEPEEERSAEFEAW
jgi:energy-coupling factor transporter ATP-binding protein EcfA2